MEVARPFTEKFRRLFKFSRGVDAENRALAENAGDARVAATNAPKAMQKLYGGKTILELFAEAQAKREAEAERAAAEAAEAAERALLPVRMPVTPMVDTPSHFDLRGFQFVLPANTRVQDVQLALEHQGEPVLLVIRCRQVAETQGLEALFGDEIEALEQRHAPLRIIRRREALLAGSEALSVDYHFSQGHEHRQGRLVAGLVPQAGGSAPQWVSIGCVIDPSLEALSDWLVRFDQMLGELAAT